MDQLGLVHVAEERLDFPRRPAHDLARLLRRVVHQAARDLGFTLIKTGGNDVTSIFRNPDHTDDVENTGASPVVADVEQLSVAQLADLLDEEAAQEIDPFFADRPFPLWRDPERLEEELRIAREIQTIAMDELPYVPVGSYLSITALRRNLADRVAAAAELGCDQRGGEVVGGGVTTLLDHLGVVGHQLDRGLHAGLGHVADAVLAVHDQVGEASYLTHFLPAQLLIGVSIGTTMSTLGAAASGAGGADASRCDGRYDRAGRFQGEYEGPDGGQPA